MCVSSEAMRTQQGQVASLISDSLCPVLWLLSGHIRVLHFTNIQKILYT